MAEACSSCGAELFAGQQFCRRCGAPTRKFSTAEVPTQILPEARAAAPEPQRDTGRTETTPLAPRETADAGYESRFAGYQSAAAGGGRAPMAPMAPTVGASRRGWLWALLAVLIASVAISAIVARQFAVHWAGKKAAPQPKVVKVNVPKVEIPDVVIPPLPPVLRGEEGGGAPLDEEGAEVTGDKTVITETFPLGEDGRLTIVNTAGNITVEGWDEEEAEVRITKRGGTAEDRAAARIIRTESEDRLTLRTEESSRRLHEVRYEIKVPRSVRQLEIMGRDSNVKVANVEGGLSVRVERGDIELTNVGGVASTHTMKGHTRVTLADAEPADAQVFSGVSGDIELRLKPGTNAQIKAQTVDGDIEADRSLGLDMQKRAAGWHAAGTVGQGGEPILVKTVSGNIKIRG